MVDLLVSNVRGWGILRYGLILVMEEEDDFEMLELITLYGPGFPTGVKNMRRSAPPQLARDSSKFGGESMGGGFKQRPENLGKVLEKYL